MSRICNLGRSNQETSQPSCTANGKCNPAGSQPVTEVRRGIAERAAATTPTAEQKLENLTVKDGTVTGRLLLGSGAAASSFSISTTQGASRFGSLNHSLQPGCSDMGPRYDVKHEVDKEGKHYLVISAKAETDQLTATIGGKSFTIDAATERSKVVVPSRPASPTQAPELKSATPPAIAPTPEAAGSAPTAEVREKMKKLEGQVAELRKTVEAQEKSLEASQAAAQKMETDLKDKVKQLEKKAEAASNSEQQVLERAEQAEKAQKAAETARKATEGAYKLKDSMTGLSTHEYEAIRELSKFSKEELPQLQAAFKEATAGGDLAEWVNSEMENTLYGADIEVAQNLLKSGANLGATAAVDLYHAMKGFGEKGDYLPLGISGAGTNVPLLKTTLEGLKEKTPEEQRGVVSEYKRLFFGRDLLEDIKGETSEEEILTLANKVLSVDAELKTSSTEPTTADQETAQPQAEPTPAPAQPAEPIAPVKFEELQKQFPLKQPGSTPETPTPPTPQQSTPLREPLQRVEPMPQFVGINEVVSPLPPKPLPAEIPE